VFEIYLIELLVARARECIAEVRRDPDRGEIAEKVILIGVFVLLAIAVGAIMATAIKSKANNIARQINTP
jgi:hypothetical protein